MKMHRPGSTYQYILEEDRDSAKPTIFNLFNALTWEQMEEVNAKPALALEDAVEVMRIKAVAEEEDRELSDDENKKIGAMMGKEASSRLNHQNAKSCNYGIKSIENLYDMETGELMDVSSKETSENKMSISDFVINAPVVVLRELGMQIIKGNELKGDALKN